MRIYIDLNSIAEKGIPSGRYNRVLKMKVIDLLKSTNGVKILYVSDN
jgi:hypothetical protein